VGMWMSKCLLKLISRKLGILFNTRNAWPKSTERMLGIWNLCFDRNHFLRNSID
jgi:hypothetical protein